MDVLNLKLILVTNREVLADAIKALLHLAIGEESELVAFSDFEQALADAPLSSSDIMLLEADDDVIQRVEKLRKLFPQGSVIVLTQSTDHDLGLACIRAGAADYVTLEEISPSSLFRTLRFSIERREVQHALQNSQAQLSQAQKMEAIGRMASGLAHDFRQYIQVIVGNSKVLQRLSEDNETITQLVNDISQAGYGANELVSHVLDFAREGPEAKHALELSNVLLANQAMLDSVGKKIEMKLSPTSEVLLIDGDTIQMGQIILNLAINAVDSCSDRGTVQLRTRALKLTRKYSDPSLTLEPGSYALLEVRDTGSGIPKDIRQKLFDPFFTTKPRGQGTGLGLSTVFTLVRGMNGLIAFWSEIGLGTTFTVFLPTSEPLPEVEILPIRRPVALLPSSPTERAFIRHDLQRLRCPVKEFMNLSDAQAWCSLNFERMILVPGEHLGNPWELNNQCLVLSSIYSAPDSKGHSQLSLPYSVAQFAKAITSVPTVRGPFLTPEESSLEELDQNLEDE